MFAPPVKVPAAAIAPRAVPTRAAKPPQYMSWRSAAGISNQAMLRLGSSSASLQPKLAIGPVDDPLEQEADRVADQVMRAPAPEPAISGTPPQLSRKCAECEAADEGQMLQTRGW